MRVRSAAFVAWCAFAAVVPRAWADAPAASGAVPQPQAASPPAPEAPSGSGKTQSPPAPDRGAFVGLWVVPWATHHFQGAGWDGGYHRRWIAGQYRVGFLQNGYEPVSGTPLLTLDRTQRFLLDLEIDARWRFNKAGTLALGGGVGITSDWVDTTSMNGVAWTTATDVQWRVRPLVALTMTSVIFRSTLEVYLESNPEAIISLGVYWGRR